jgi:hypothetical protein
MLGAKKRHCREISKNYVLKKKNRASGCAEQLEAYRSRLVRFAYSPHLRQLLARHLPLADLFRLTAFGRLLHQD